MFDRFARVFVDHRWALAAVTSRFTLVLPMSPEGVLSVVRLRAAMTLIYCGSGKGRASKR